MQFVEVSLTHWKRESDGGVFLGGDSTQGLEIPAQNLIRFYMTWSWVHSLVPQHTYCWKCISVGEYLDIIENMGNDDFWKNKQTSVKELRVSWKWWWWWEKNDDDDKEDDDYAIFQEQYKLSLKSGRRVAITMMMMAKTIATWIKEQLARWR